jgi:methionyl-tRNA formyltransferase
VRVVFCGTPIDAVPALEAVVTAGHDVALVVTQPDRRRGRGGASAPSPVKDAAARLGLPVRTPNRARELVDEIRALDAALGVVVAFGQLLPTALLDATQHGFVNLHFSLLPRWRGAAPVERAVLAGDAETGVCVMQLDVGLDTGAVYACTRTPIGDDETAGDLRARLVGLGAPLLVATLPRVGVDVPVPQEGDATLAPKLSVAEFRIDPARPADELARLVRAGSPRPGAWTVVGGRRLKVLRAHAQMPDAEVPDADAPEPGSVDVGARLGTAAGWLVLDEVQPEGRDAMAGRAWRSGLRGEPASFERP